jgi:hypothetical protein
MRIYRSHGTNSILFEFTEHKFNNKINSFLQYSKHFTKKFFKRKEKPSGVYYDYIWGYKTKEPETYYTRHVYPVDMRITQSEVLKYAISDMEEKHNIYVDKSDPAESNIYYLRAIEIHYIYT